MLRLREHPECRGGGPRGELRRGEARAESVHVVEKKTTMPASTFDAFSAARALEAAGVERRQAEAIAAAVAAQTITRPDLDPLATKAEMRWKFGFQAALIFAMAAKLFGIV